jgi:two-component system chemotaxis response regulator CheB
MRSMFDLICIGSSTGGPPVLETIVKALPAGLTIPVVIAQHMPRMFTASMAERLDGMGALPVRHAEDRMPIEAGTVYVASGDAHTSIEKRGPGRACLRVGPKPTDALYRPSVDVLFTTAADACGPRVLAVILTGMGHDGFEGGKHLHEVGGKIIAQSAESCVVYGMPKAITESGIASASLPPSDIAATLASLGSAPLRASA